MRKLAILLCVWLLCAASLTFGAAAFASGGKHHDHKPSDCMYFDSCDDKSSKEDNSGKGKDSGRGSGREDRD